MPIQTILWLTLLASLSCSQKYLLKILEPPDCNYCKFAQKQIKSIISQNHWYKILKLQVIDCQKQASQCRDLQNRPLLTLFNQDGVKIKQIGGVRSRIFFRDWISDTVDNNYVEVRQVEDKGSLYRKVQIGNVQEIVGFYYGEVERQKSMERDKVDIRMEAFKNIIQSSEIQSILQTPKQVNQLVTQQTIEIVQADGNFRSQLRNLIMIASPIGLLVMLFLFKAKFCKDPANQSLQIPSQEQ